MDTVTIPKAEYLRLKELEKVDWELVGKFKSSLDTCTPGACAGSGKGRELEPGYVQG